MKKNLLAVVGPTASGKTALAVALAHRLQTEIISADSRQIYRGMDLGTGKDLDEYVVDGIKVPYHLIDICDAGYKYNLFEYQRDFLQVYRDMESRKMLPVLCGGTGLYVEAVLKGYQLLQVPDNPALRETLEGKSLEELTGILRRYKNLHNQTDVDTVKRAIRAIEIAAYYDEHPFEELDVPNIRPLVVGVDIDRELRRTKITDRLKKRLESGMVDEVRGLIESGIAPEDLIYYGLEYKFLTQYVIGELSYEEMFSQLEVAIHQFAKRQMTWFRGMEKRGVPIRWLSAQMPREEQIEQVLRWLSEE